MPEDMVKIYQILQNFKYVVLENIYVLKIAVFKFFLGTYFYANYLFLK